MSDDRPPSSRDAGIATDADPPRPATGTNAPSEPTASPRPVIERLGLAAIAALLAAVFAFVGLAAWTSGEIFLGVMAGIGALMTVWAAASTLGRG